MGPRTVAKRSRVQAFVRVFNTSHLMCTRYTIKQSHLTSLQNSVPSKALLDGEDLNTRNIRAKAAGALQKLFTDASEPYLFRKIRF